MHRLLLTSFLAQSNEQENGIRWVFCHHQNSNGRVHKTTKRADAMNDRLPRLGCQDLGGVVVLSFSKQAFVFYRVTHQVQTLLLSIRMYVRHNVMTKRIDSLEAS